jgi:cytidyltransferase-like protein
MKFNKTLNANIINEWQFYSIDYKAMKKTLKAESGAGAEAGMEGSDVSSDFFALLEQSQAKLTKFYTEKEAWATAYLDTVEDRLNALRHCKVSVHLESPTEGHISTDSENYSTSESEDDSSEDEGGHNISRLTHPLVPSNLAPTNTWFSTADPKATVENQEWLKEEYRRVGKSEHFQSYIYAKKSLDTFARELDLVLEFLALNKVGFSKILKKFDKKTGSSIREEKMDELVASLPYLEGDKIKALRRTVTDMLGEVDSLKPPLPRGWGLRKVYTIGCFDLFHRGHQNVLRSLREFGCFIVAGIHDDESYFKLKNKYTIDNLETRMKNVKPFVDQLFVIPSTDPALYLKCMVSEQDIETGSCCYARGDDMKAFPGREWVESVMPVHFVPRTESCSSTLIRTIYHADDPEIRKKAAFANTRYDGKPVDENGNVLKI